MSDLTRRQRARAHLHEAASRVDHMDAVGEPAVALAGLLHVGLALGLLELSRDSRQRRSDARLKDLVDRLGEYLDTLRAPPLYDLNPNGPEEIHMGVQDILDATAKETTLVGSVTTMLKAIGAGLAGQDPGIVSHLVTVIGTHPEDFEAALIANTVHVAPAHDRRGAEAGAPAEVTPTG